jgi:hypothetical protein
MRHNEMNRLIPNFLPVFDSKKYKERWSYDVDVGELSKEKAPLKVEWARYFESAVRCIINGETLAMVAEFSDYHEKFLGSATKAVRRAAELAKTHKVTSKSEEVSFEVVATLVQVPFVTYAGKRVPLHETLVPVTPDKPEDHPGLMYLKREPLKDITVWSSKNAPEQNRLFMVAFKAEYLIQRGHEVVVSR